MRRREFIAGLGGAAVTATVGTLTALGQRAKKVMHLGYLAQARLPLPIEAMLTGFREFDYVEGQNLVIEYRFEQGQSKSLDELAAELVRLGPAVIVTIGTPAALAAKRATTTIPIVMATVGEVLRTGLVTNLARPGGNITGLTLYADQLSSKRLELFKEMVPRIERVAVLGNANNPIHGYYWDDMQPSGRALGLNLRLFDVKELNDLSTTFITIKQEESDSLIVLSDVRFNAVRKDIIGLAAFHRLPAMYEAREFVEDGGLACYGPSIADLSRRSAALIVKIFQGANPGDLPVEQPTKFELIINRKTAKVFGLDIPPTLLARADEVIE
jgi:putative tryptophan/tyrosine transport system substrate-binding protein